VLEGEVTFQTREEVVTARGSILACRRRNPHTFANLGERDARLLVTCTTAGFLGYFDRLAAGEAAVPPPGDCRWPTNSPTRT